MTSFLDRWLRRDGTDDDDYGYDEVMEDDGYEDEPEQHQRVQRRQGSRVVDIKSGGARTSQQEVVLVAPHDFSMTWQICDYVKENKTVICNIEAVPSDFRQRFVDFINGAAYALGGVIRPISKFIFVFAPKSTTVSIPEAVEQIERHQAFEREPQVERPVRSSERYMRTPRQFQVADR